MRKSIVVFAATTSLMVFSATYLVVGSRTNFDTAPTVYKTNVAVGVSPTLVRSSGLIDLVAEAETPLINEQISIVRELELRHEEEARLRGEQPVMLLPYKTSPIEESDTVTEQQEHDGSEEQGHAADGGSSTITIDILLEPKVPDSSAVEGSTQVDDGMEDGPEYFGQFSVQTMCMCPACMSADMGIDAPGLYTSEAVLPAGMAVYFESDPSTLYTTYSSKLELGGRDLILAYEQHSQYEGGAVLYPKVYEGEL